jgi:hypothetical protein
VKRGMRPSPQSHCERGFAESFLLNIQLIIAGPEAVDAE